MKKILLSITLLSLFIPSLKAQDYNALNKFLKLYSSCDTVWMGKEMPKFNFDTSLNSNALKGKIVILDYWATWCSACHSMGKELNEKLTSKYYNDKLQIIGVNNEHTTHPTTKTSPKEFWKANGYKYPMVEGKAAVASCEAVKSGFPTVILIDPQGNIRGRWDAYDEQVTDMIKLCIWVLMNPNQTYTSQMLTDAMRLHNYYKGLYICEQLLPNQYDATIKLKCMLHVADWVALDYGNALFEYGQKNLKGDNYESLLSNMCAEIVEANVLSTDINKLGLKIANELSSNFEGYKDDYEFLDYIGRLYWRTGQKEKAIEIAKQCIDISEKQKLNKITIDYFKGVLKSYEGNNK